MPRASRAAERRRRLQGLLPYAVVLAAAAVLFFLSGRFQFAAKPGELGPDVWPKAILALLITVCAFEIVRRLRGAEGADAQGADLAGQRAEPGEEVEAPAPRLPHLLAAGIALTLLYVATLETLGFFLATAAYLALFMLIGRYRRPVAVALTSLIGSLAFVFVFMKIVYVSLPLGVGPFQTVSIWILGLLGIR